MKKIIRSEPLLFVLSAITVICLLCGVAALAATKGDFAKAAPFFIIGFALSVCSQIAIFAYLGEQIDQINKLERRVNAQRELLQKVLTRDVKFMADKVYSTLHKSFVEKGYLPQDSVAYKGKRAIIMRQKDGGRCVR